MSSAPELPSTFAIPRPGVLTALGICNIVFSLLSFFCIVSSGIFILAATTVTPVKAEVKVQAKPGPGVQPGVPMSVGFNPFMGMEDKNLVRFSIAENGTSVLINGLMFATGIGLINLKRWAARWWGYLAWVKIVLSFLLWGYFIVGVVPGFSETVAKNVSAMFVQMGAPRGRAPSVADLTRVYSILYLIMGLGAMVISSIYPANSLWLLSRPGVKAAIVDKPALEHELL